MPALNSKGQDVFLVHPHSRWEEEGNVPRFNVTFE